MASSSSTLARVACAIGLVLVLGCVPATPPAATPQAPTPAPATPSSPTPATLPPDPTPTAAPAAFEVASLALEPKRTTYSEGDSVQLLVAIRNVGGTEGSYRARLLVNGASHSSHQISLDPGETDTLWFALTLGAPGEHQLQVGEQQLAVTVAEPLLPAAFEIANLTAAPNPDSRGELFVTAEVTNVGERPGTEVVALWVDGTFAQAQQVTLAAGATRRVQFYVSGLEPGRHQLAVGDLTASVDVEGSRPPAASRPTNGKVIVNRVKGGLGRLTVDNGNDRDAFVVLARAGDGSPMLALYVRAGKKATVKRVKNGTYDLYFSLGSAWDSSQRAFTEDVAFRRMDGQLRFTTTRVRSGTRFTIYTVTLHGVPGGGVPIQNVDPGDFPSP
ncbi:MAG TPA: hypothetical protein VNT28_00975 [Candidatus Limnocylindrales bacterium]|jgi:hypothetical protein|nr:hypothetical protein [Candidatus Limnocylindrales bacterium]